MGAVKGPALERTTQIADARGSKKTRKITPVKPSHAVPSFGPARPDDAPEMFNSMNQHTFVFCL
jgi:hypothetical protein